MKDINVNTYDNHPISCTCKTCQHRSCKNARNAFYDFMGRGDIAHQRNLFVDFYCLWFSDDDWDDEDEDE